MGGNPVVQSYAYLLAHAPEFVRYGSKPKREIGIDPGLAGKIEKHLRSFEEAVHYPPNQVFLGNLHPEDLATSPAPWWQNPIAGATRDGAYGPFLDQLEIYGFLKAVDQFDLVWFTSGFTGASKHSEPSVGAPADVANPCDTLGQDSIKNQTKTLPLYQASLPAPSTGRMTRTKRCRRTCCWKIWSPKPRGHWRSGCS
jgi:hypothetical protein